MKHAVREYFLDHAPQDAAHVTSRAINALERKGIRTMDMLCTMSAYELRRVRNLGDKSIALSMQMREMYASERADR